MKFLRLPIFLPIFLLVFANSEACPDCALKSSGGLIEPQTMTAKMAFSSSTLLMLVIVFSVIGFMAWIMVKTCRDISRERPLSSNSGG